VRIMHGISLTRVGVVVGWLDKVYSFTRDLSYVALLYTIQTSKFWFLKLVCSSGVPMEDSAEGLHSSYSSSSTGAGRCLMTAS
jgi:hypothetical protein